MSATLASFSLGEFRLTSLVMTHMAKTYQIINKRLSGPEALCDGSIAVVTSLAMHEDLNQQQSTAMLHFQGLRRMIDLRGGIKQLFLINRHIGQKVWSIILDDLRRAREKTRRHSFLQWVRDTSTDVLDIAFDVIDFTELLDTRTNDNKLFALDYTDALLVLTGSLLEVAPVGRELRHCRDNLVHKSLLAYMVAFRPEYGRRLAKYDLLGQGLRSSTQAFTPVTIADYELLLWCLFCGGIQVFDEGEEWLSLMIVRACEYLRLRTWAETRHVLYNIAWIPTIHDKAGEALWKSFEGNTHRTS
ncbi:hypothetical protein PG993_010441 [Apiospora rasikravindrae]|uniref:Uncharacterized protein n=1 Tax=Apiospora rasikravindrae TaxID=990691 RepID=A0ABR1SM78_9PEZI